MIFSTLQAGFKDLTVTKITEIITTALPSSSGPLSFIKAAYISVVLTNKKKTGRKAKQKRPYSGFRNHFPTCPMYSHCRFAGKMKSSDTSLPQKQGRHFYKMGIEFLNGVCHIVEAIYEYEQMKEEKSSC
ncbi:MAG: hypothetical protein ACLUIQ_02900 [Dialister invisus]